MNLPNMPEATWTEKISPPMTTAEIVNYIVQSSEQLQTYARSAQAMIEEAKEHGIDLETDPSVQQTLEKFAVHGEYELLLIKMAGALRDIGSLGYEKGMRVTAEDLAERLAAIQQK